jgi:hypothetical protein
LNILHFSFFLQLLLNYKRWRVDQYQQIICIGCELVAESVTTVLLFLVPAAAAQLQALARGPVPADHMYRL